MKKRKMLSIGSNTKLKNGKIGVFNLPAGKPVCAMECPGCYAKETERYRKAVRPFRKKNYEDSKKPDFVDNIIEEIKKNLHKIKAIRIHESGDFYSQKYVDKWEKIASTFPRLKFFAYTKRIKDFDMSKLAKMKNFILINSLQHGFNYGTIEEIKPQIEKGAFLCPSGPHKYDKISCNYGCNFCLTKKAQKKGVVFLKH